MFRTITLLAFTLNLGTALPALGDNDPLLSAYRARLEELKAQGSSASRCERFMMGQALKTGVLGAIVAVGGQFYAHYGPGLFWGTPIFGASGFIVGFLIGGNVVLVHWGSAGEKSGYRLRTKDPTPSQLEYIEIEEYLTAITGLKATSDQSGAFNMVVGALEAWSLSTKGGPADTVFVDGWRDLVRERFLQTHQSLTFGVQFNAHALPHHPFQHALQSVGTSLIRH